MTIQQRWDALWFRFQCWISHRDVYRGTLLNLTRLNARFTGVHLDAMVHVTKQEAAWLNVEPETLVALSEICEAHDSVRDGVPPQHSDGSSGAEHHVTADSDRSDGLGGGEGE